MTQLLDTNAREFDGRCTSGRYIARFGGLGRPCGTTLVALGKSSKGETVYVCPSCDALPRK